MIISDLSHFVGVSEDPSIIGGFDVTKVIIQARQLALAGVTVSAVAADLHVNVSAVNNSSLWNTFDKLFNPS